MRNQLISNLLKFLFEMKVDQSEKCRTLGKTDINCYADFSSKRHDEFIKFNKKTFAPSRNELMKFLMKSFIFRTIRFTNIAELLEISN